MRSDNVLLLTLLWTLTALCRDEDDISVICQNVTGSVGNDVNLTCSVSLNSTECCVEMYRFLYPKRYNNSEICREIFPYDSCIKRDIFTCSYSPTTAMTEQFRFFPLTTCGYRITQFTVDITESLKRETETKPEAPDQTGHGREVIVITVCCLIFIIIIIVTVTGVKKMRNRNPPESQKKYDRAASEQTTTTTNV